MSTLKTTYIQHPSSGSANITLSSDGTLAMSTVRATNIQHPSAVSENVTLSSDGTVALPFSSISDLGAEVNSKPNVVNTDGNSGKTFYVGATDPSLSYTLVPGDVWIEVPA